jgi:hypothetical protein
MIQCNLRVGVRSLTSFPAFATLRRSRRDDSLVDLNRLGVE